MMSASAEQLDAQRDQDYEDRFDNALTDLCNEPKYWSGDADEIFCNMEEQCKMVQDIARNWKDEAEIGRLMKAYLKDAWYEVFNSGGN